MIARAGLFLSLALIMLVATLPSLTQAQEDSRYFPETGFTVRGPLLNFFDTRGGLAIFGYPITEAFVERGVQVQYFQNTRIEWRPNNPDPYKVQLGLLADELRYGQPRVPAPTLRSRRRIYFAETGHTVAYAFLDYFNANGGLDVFGYPITEMHYADGIIVQYFQRLKMEWRPEDSTNQVHIGNLGEQYVNLYRDRIPAAALTRTSPIISVTPIPTTGSNITALRAVVSLRFSVLGQPNATQTISILVTDNNGNAIEDATVNINLVGAGGKNLGVLTARTDTRGFARLDTLVREGKTGDQVVVQATVTYGTLVTSAQNVFLLWW